MVVTLIDLVRRIGVARIQQRIVSLVGVSAVISATTLLLLIALIWSAPNFYYHNGNYLYPGTWLDMSCITKDDTYLVVMMVVSPAFGIASFVCDMWLMRWLAKSGERAS